MSEQRAAAIKAAVLEWQKKYQVGDADPLLASLELFQIYLENIQSTFKNDKAYLPSFLEFRDVFELLDERTKRISKETTDLMEVMRGIPNLRKQLRACTATAFLLTALGAFVSGVLVGVFVL